jgi:transcriptional regulator GlxA family with amidase domain
MNIGTVLFHNVNELEVALAHSLLHDAATYAAPARGDHAEQSASDLSSPDASVPDASTPDASTPEHQVFTVAKSRHSVQTQHALTLTPTWAFAGAPPMDVLIVPSGLALPVRDSALVSYLRDAAKEARYLLAIGSGVAVLGAAGLLTGLEVAAVPGLHDYLESCEVRAVRHEPLVLNGARAAAPTVWCVLGGVHVLEASLTLAEALFGADIAATVRARHYVQGTASRK